MPMESDSLFSAFTEEMSFDNMMDSMASINFLNAM
jgi:hypothetical protein